MRIWEDRITCIRRNRALVILSMPVVGGFSVAQLGRFRAHQEVPFSVYFIFAIAALIAGYIAFRLKVRTISSSPYRLNRYRYVFLKGNEHLVDLKVKLERDGFNTSSYPSNTAPGLLISYSKNISENKEANKSGRYMRVSLFEISEGIIGIESVTYLWERELENDSVLRFFNTDIDTTSGLFLMDFVKRNGYERHLVDINGQSINLNWKRK